MASNGVGEIPTLNLDSFGRRQLDEHGEQETHTERIQQPFLSQPKSGSQDNRELDVVHTDRNIVARSCKPNRGVPFTAQMTTEDSP